MSKFVTIAAVALTLGLGAAGPAFADGQGNGYGNPHGQSNHGQQGATDNYGQTDNDGQYDNDADEDRAYQPERGERRDFEGRNNFRDDRGAWERTWRPWQDQAHYSRFEVLPRWKLIRKLERQGYYDIRDLAPSRHGQGWRAFARVGRGAFVMLRVDPHSGRVIAAHRV